MGKHRLKQESRLPISVRGAVVAGSVIAGTVGLPAAQAAAATIEIPGLGKWDVPDMPGLPPTVTLPAVAPMAPPPAPFSAPMQAAPTNIGQKALDAAKTKIGTYYAWGAAGPNAFDCSGLVQWAYKQAGVSVPRTSYDQARAGAPVSIADLKPGDIVITNGGGHAALYAGDGQILHASVAGTPVQYAPLREQTFYAARRL